MKTAVSLPDELFEAVEKIVKRSKRHRSEIYADALREYVARHSDDEITAALKAALENIHESEEDKQFRRAATYHSLKRIEWS
jgi:metal-responsive CopG/Arc/MetJ family transcriptional regulator